jgi:phenylalanyl-tRNA synthetase alpha chain
MKKLKEKIDSLRQSFDHELKAIEDDKSLSELRNIYLSRKRGHLNTLFNELKNITPDDKPQAGQLINAFKTEIREKLDGLKASRKGREETMAGLDLTLPGRKRYWGAPHPLVVFQQRIEDIFLRMGFLIESGPEIETDYYCFEALNFPPHHPARDDWDTLYINDEYLLRTHTSPVQIRVMQKKKPPIRIITPGKVFRKESPDPTHLPMFFQVEGLVVDHGITMAHLKGTLEYFLKALFHEKIQIRFRPSFFPFTEPSAEVDIECTVCSRKDPKCRVCGGGGWIEILGAGMVDPQVFKNVNIDPERYSGFAFGLGVDRTAMFAYQIPDMRYFYENDLRFLRQFTRK